MRDRPTDATAPEVRPLGELDWTAKDARWLAGGRRLQIVLAVLLIGLTFAPVRIIEHGPSLATMPASEALFLSVLHGEWEPAGVHWRWSPPPPGSERVRPLFMGYRPDRPVDRWMWALLPAVAGVLLVFAAFLPSRGRSSTVFMTGSLLLMGTAQAAGIARFSLRWANPGAAFMVMFTRDDAPNWASQTGDLPLLAAFPMALILLAVGGFRAGWRGGTVGVRRMAALLPALPAVLPALIELIRLIGLATSGEAYALMMPPPWVQDAGPIGWIVRGGELLFMTCWMLIGLLALINAFVGDRRVAAGGFWTGWILLAAALVTALGRPIIAAVRDGGALAPDISDRLLGLGDSLHQTVTFFAGAALMIGSSARLWVGFTRPRPEPPADAPDEPPPVSSPPQKGGQHA